MMDSGIHGWIEGMMHGGLFLRLADQKDGTMRAIAIGGGVGMGVEGKGL